MRGLRATYFRRAAPAAAFVGRSGDLEVLGALFDEGACLVTVTGAAGIGKTALAVRFAARRPGAVVCDLTEARDAAGIRAVVAQALGLSDVDASLSTLGPLLMVLDNFEHLVAHAEDTIASWLEGVPELQILVTSRARLRIRGERVHELGPLDAVDAARLWTARVGESGATAGEASSVARILRELDGLPLAIELAAARMTTLTPAELLERLDVLAAPGSSLRQAIDVSWALLDARERTAFAACSLFHGRIALAAAEAVIGDAAVELLQSLRDKSLLARDGDQLTMFVSLRKYAEERFLELEDHAPFASRYEAYFLAYAERCFELARTDLVEASRRAAKERENLLAVVSRNLAPSGSVERALRILVAIDEPHWRGGSPAAHVGLFDRAIAHERAAEVSANLLARAWIARGRIAWRIGRLEASVADLERAVAAAEGDRALESLARRFLSLSLHVCGRVDESEREAIEALRIAEELGDARLRALALSMHGFIARLRGAPARARRFIEEALADFCEAGDRPSELDMRVELVFLHLDEGALDAVGVYVDQAFALQERLGLAPSPRLLVALGHVALDAGDPTLAASRYEEAAGAARRTGEIAWELMASGCKTVALFAEGRVVEARSELVDARQRAKRLGQSFYGALTDGIAAVYAAKLGHEDDARALLDSADREVEGSPSHRVAIALCRSYVELVSAGDEDSARGLLLAAVTSSQVQLISEVRILARLLGRAPAPREAPPAVLVLDGEARWFEAPGGPRVDVGGRPVMRRMLHALADAHRERVTLPSTKLIAACWPGERIRPSSARNRLHVMLTRLRALGLRDWIAVDDRGYGFSPALSIERR